MKDNIILLGGGGHCKACIDVIEQAGRFRIAGIVDLPDKLQNRVLDHQIFATDKDLPRLLKEYKYFLVTIGQIRSVDKRIELFNRLKDNKAKLPVIVSPMAYISSHAKIEEGSIIMHHAIINAGAHVGKNCIINTRALVEHDAVIENHCHISTGTLINGGSKIESGTFFGSGSVCRENITIGKKSFIGMHSKIYKNLPAYTLIK